MDLTGTVVLVTGACSGIGAATARAAAGFHRTLRAGAVVPGAADFPVHPAEQVAAAILALVRTGQAETSLLLSSARVAVRYAVRRRLTVAAHGGCRRLTVGLPGRHCGHPGGTAAPDLAPGKGVTRGGAHRAPRPCRRPGQAAGVVCQSGWPGIGGVAGE